jgi:iron complex transport system ATP-binding protein
LREPLELPIYPQLPEITSNISVEQIIAMGRYHASRNNFNNNDYIIIKNSAEVTNTSNLLNRNIKTLSGGERQRVFAGISFSSRTPNFITR